MHDGFVPLRVVLRATPEPAPHVQTIAFEDRDVAPAESDSGRLGMPAEFDDVLSAARRFKAALADALALSLERLVRDIACEVLTRELELAPSDVATIAARALQRYVDEEPVRVRVHSADVAACAGLDIAIVADASLRPGDAVLEVRCGSIDASLGARLEAILS